MFTANIAVGNCIKMVKNYFVKTFRISKEYDNLVREISQVSNFKRHQIDRWVYFKGILELKKDIAKAGGVTKIIFDMKEIKRINS